MIAVAFYQQVFYDRGLEWYRRRRTPAGGEKTQGKDHPDAFPTVYCMVAAFCKKGKSDEVLELHHRALPKKSLSKGRHNCLQNLPSNKRS